MMSGLAADGVDYIPGCNGSQQAGVDVESFRGYIQNQGIEKPAGFAAGCCCSDILVVSLCLLQRRVFP